MTRLLRQQRPVLSPPRRMFDDAIIPSIKHADLLRGRTRNGAAVQHHHNGLNRLHPAATANTRHATPTCGLTVPQCVCGFPMAFFWCTALRTACCCALSIKCWCPAVMTVHADTQTKVQTSRRLGPACLVATCCPDGAVTNSTRTRSVLESQCVRLKKDSDWEFLVRVNRYGAFQSHRNKISWTAQREASSSARWSLASELPPVQMRMDGESSTTHSLYFVLHFV